MNNSARIACCNICLLDDRMKTCQSCPLNPANLTDLKPEELAQVARQELLTQSQKDKIK